MDNQKKTRGKYFAVIALLVFTIVGFIAASRTWVVYELVPGEAAFGWLFVTGAQALAPLMPILIALGAVAITLLIVAKIVRVGLGVLTALLGAWITVGSFRLLDASFEQLLRFGSVQISEATGVLVTSGNETVADVTLSAWPLVSGIVGVGFILVGLFITLTGYRWATGGRKYETKKVKQADTQSRDRKTDRIDDWDALSDGEDPSETN